MLYPGIPDQRLKIELDSDDRVASGYGVTLLPEVAADVEVRNERVKLLRFVEPQPQRQIGLAWRPTSPRKADFLELGQILFRALKFAQG